MTNITLQRVDLGWRNSGGDYGIITSHDGPLPDGIGRELLGWCDRARGTISEHWYWVGLGEHLALIRITPQEGGVRGVASTAQAVVLLRSDVIPATDLRELLSVFPAAPLQIGASAAWQAKAVIDRVALEQIGTSFKANELPLTSLIAQLLGTPLWEIPMEHAHSSLLEEISDALLFFALCPTVSPQTLVPRFASRSAPLTTYYSVFRFSITPTMHLPQYEAAAKWVAIGIYLNSNDVFQLDPMSYESPEAQFIHKALESKTPNILEIAKIFHAFGRDAQSKNALQEIVIDCFEKMPIRQRTSWVNRFHANKSTLDEAGVPSLLPWKIMANREVLEQLLIFFPDRLPDYIPDLIQRLPGSIIGIVPSATPALHRLMLAAFSPNKENSDQFPPWITNRHADALRVLLARNLDDIDEKRPQSVSPSLDLCNIIHIGLRQPNHSMLEVDQVIVDTHLGITRAARRFAQVLLDSACQIELFFTWFPRPINDEYGAARCVARALTRLHRNGELRSTNAALAQACKASDQAMNKSQRTLLALLKAIEPEQTEQAIPRSQFRKKLNER